MAENTNIEWCDHTFNPWTGCTKVSPGCANCYAEGWSKRSGIVTWGKGQPRRRTSASNWNLPLKWNKQAMGEKLKHEIDHDQALRRGETPHYQALRSPRVFCSSLADWLDDEVPVEWFVNLLETIHATPHLDWLLLTKRPENFQSRMDQAFQFGELTCGRHVSFINAIGAWSQAPDENGVPWDNVWIGTTVEDQQRADERIPALLNIPAKIHFLSCEPLLGPVDLFAACFNDTDDSIEEKIHFGINHHGLRFGVDWVICGGESGSKARPMHPAWAKSLRNQCEAAGVPFLFKQWGEWLPFGQGHAYMDKFKEARLVGNGPRATGVPCYLVGKKPAGRLLDGREWNEFPTA